MAAKTSFKQTSAFSEHVLADFYARTRRAQGLLPKPSKREVEPILDQFDAANAAGHRS